MSFKFNCPLCGQQVSAEEAWIGKVAPCPTCHKNITIQKPQAAQPEVVQQQQHQQPVQPQQYQHPVQQQPMHPQVVQQPVQPQQYQQPVQPQQYQQPVQPQIIVQTNTAYQAKSRVVYILLAIFLGYFGIHNFYAGYIGRGVIQLLINIFLDGLIGVFLILFLPLALIPALCYIFLFIWVILEIICVSHDAHGVPFN